MILWIQIRNIRESVAIRLTVSVHFLTNNIFNHNPELSILVIWFSTQIICSALHMIEWLYYFWYHRFPSESLDRINIRDDIILWAHTHMKRTLAKPIAMMKYNQMQVLFITRQICVMCLLLDTVQGSMSCVTWKSHT